MPYDAKPMKEAVRPAIITGNWKMYKTSEDARSYVQALIPKIQQSHAKIYLAVPYTVIRSAVKASNGSSLVIGAQNMHDATEGAFTGEIAAQMLIDEGAKFVLLGHSERRKLFNEDNAFINRKVKKAFKAGLQPTLCVGELLDEREQGLTEQVLTTQLTECLEGLDADQAEGLILAYEPVWAIGTDQPATPEMAQEAHKICRDWLEEYFGADFAAKTVIQYGGSVKVDNAKDLLDQPDIDGLLIGAASLKTETFSTIVNLVKDGAS